MPVLGWRNSSSLQKQLHSIQRAYVGTCMKVYHNYQCIYAMYKLSGFTDNHVKTSTTVKP